MQYFSSSSRLGRVFRRSTSVTTTFALAASALLGATINAQPAQAVQRIDKQTGFNARAWSVTSADAQGNRYIGGDFTSYQAWNTGQAGVVNTTDGQVNPSFPQVDGWPYEKAAVADGSGGWFIGGAMNNVGGTSVTRVAHVLADGSVDSAFHPSITGGQAVLAMAKYGDTIIIGGNFNAVNGQTRRSLAAIKTDGTLLDWNPAPNSGVMALNVFGDTAFVTGNFSTIGGLSRGLVASIRLDARTGGVTGTCLTAWDATDCMTSFDPNAAGWGVKAIAVGSTYTYIAGAFSQVGGQNHTGVAKVLTSTGAVQSWDAQLDSEAGAVAIDNGIAYFGGYFTTAGGLTRNKIAAVDIATDTITSWDPNITGSGVNSISIANGSIYFGGQFQLAAGAGRNHAAAFDAAGNLLPWNPHVGDQDNGSAANVYGVYASATGVYLLGDFRCLGGQSRMHAAAANSAGILTDWAPVVNGPVFTFSRLGSTIYMGGNFSTINGVTRSGAGAVDTSGVTTSWNPSPDGRAVSIIATSSKIYMAGWFNNVGSTAVKNLVVLDPTTAAIDSNFNANMDGAVRSMALSGDSLFIGGDFANAGGGAHAYVASLNATTGAENAAFQASTGTGSQIWPFLEAVAVVGNKVFIGGYFGQVNGQTKNFFAALDKTTGALVPGWDESVSGWVFAIAPSTDGTKVYLAGDNINVTKGSDSAQGIVALNVADGSLSSWRANTGEIRGLSVSSAVVYAAGSFGNMGSQSRQNTAAVGVAGDVLDPWPMNAADSNTLAVTIPNANPGIVTSNPSGINCGASCEYSYATGTTITLTAVPEQGQAFTGWTGACTGTTTTCTVTLSSAKATTATFGAASAPQVQAPASTPTPTTTPTVTPTVAPTPAPTETPAPVANNKVAITKAVTFAAGNAVLDKGDKRVLDALVGSITQLKTATVVLQGSAQKTNVSRQDLAVANARAKAAASYLKARLVGISIKVLPARKATDVAEAARRVVIKVSGTK